MPSVFIIYDVEGWAYHHQAKALERLAPPGFDVASSGWPRGAGPDDVLPERAPDLIFLMPRIHAKRLRRAIAARGWTVPLLVRWSVGWPRDAERLPAARAVADWIIFNNREYWERAGRPENTRWVPNGVDLELFRVTTPLAERTPKVLWAGSQVHRRLKGYDSFVAPLSEVAARHGIAFEALLTESRSNKKRPLEEMPDWYNSGTVYMCTSASEGTPNTALEAAACGCAIVSTPVGNMPELIRSGENGYLVDRDLGALARHMLAACERHAELATAMVRDIRERDWRKVAPEYFALFADVIGRGARIRANGRPDLSAEVTVFVSTVGAPGFERCMAALEAQDCRFRLEVIRNVAPMSRAFQKMLDDCKTPYYVQVDEDMVLVPHAIRELYEAIAQAPEMVATLVRPLYDPHVGRCILGVKIYRHAIVARYPFADTLSCERDQNRRLEADGYRVDVPKREEMTVGSPELLGLHGLDYADTEAFERYATLVQKRRQTPERMAWTGELPHLFLTRVLDGGSRADLVALLAMIGQTLRPDLARECEKDYRTYDRLPLLDETLRFVDILKGTDTPTEQD